MTAPNTPNPFGPVIPWSQQVADTLSSAPGLAQAPSVVTDITNNTTSPQDAQAAAQTTDLAAQKNALGQAAQAQKSSGWWGDIMDGLHLAHSALNAIPGEKTLERDVIHPVAQTMGAPLREVQHEYRYLHDIYDRHGVMAGLGASLFGIVGGVAGSLLGPEGAIGGAELGVEASRILGFKDRITDPTTGQVRFQSSYDRTADGSTYTDSSGNPVSFGRDIASAIFHDRNSTGFHAVSGGLDAAFDWFADPVMIGSKAFAAHRAGQLHAGASLSKAEQIVADAHNGDNGRVAGAFDWLAKENSAGRITSRFPSLAQLAPDLAKANDSVEVGDVFLRQLRKGTMASKWDGIFPSRSALFGTVGDWKQAIKESGQGGLGVLTPEELGSLTPEQVAARTQGTVASRVYQIVSNKQPTAVDENLGKLSNTTFNPQSIGANAGVLRAARRVYGEVGGQDFLDLWSHAQQQNNLGALKTLWENLNTHAFIRDGVTDDGLLRGIQAKTKMLTHGPGEGNIGTYAHGVDGEDLSTVSLGGDRSTQAGILEDHTGRFVFPNFGAMHDAVAALKNSQLDLSKTGQVGHAVDHVANSAILNSYIDRVFKPLAIGTSASGLRVGLSEVLTYGLKNGFGSYLKALTAAMKGKEDAYTEALTATPTKTVTIPHPSIPGDTLTTSVPGDTLTTSVPDTALAVKQQIARGWHKAGAQAVVSKFSKVLNRNEPDLAETANRLAQDGGIDNVAGHGSSALHTIHGDMSGAADEVVSGLQNVLPEGKTLGTNMDVFHAAQVHQPFAHRAALNEWVNPTGQAALKGAKEGLAKQGLRFGDALTETQRQVVLQHSSAEVEKYLRSPAAQEFTAKMLRRQTLADPDLEGDPIKQWADVAARGFEGVTAYRNPNGLVTHNPVFTRPLEQGGLPTIEQLQRNPIAMRPALVKGRELLPSATGAGLQRLVNGTFEKFFAPWVRNLSRHPLYVAAVHDTYGRLKEVADGAIDDDQLWATAKNQAITEIMPMLHNPMEKTQLEYAVKNIFPFMFAQRQQYARYGQALINNPVGFRRAQLTQQALRSTGFIQKDSSGKDIFVYPAAGHVSAVIGDALAGIGITPTALIPTGLTGQVQSLNPGAGQLYPGLSPVFSIPVQELGKLFPNELGALSAKVTAASANTPLWEQVLPFSPLKNAAKAYLGEHDAQFANSLMSVMAAAKAHDAELLAKHPGQDPTTIKGLILPPEGASPMQMQNALNHLRNWTRVHYAFMAAFGFFAPASPSAAYGNTEIQNTLKTLASQGTVGGKSALERINAYVAKNPGAMPYTVYKTMGLGGFSIPPAQASVDWAQQNAGFLKDHTLAAAALMPQLNDHNPDALALFQQQVQTGVRTYKTPEDFLKDLYIKEAAQPYFAAKKIHDNLQAAYANDPQAKQAEQAQWAQAQGQFFASHPVFQQWVTSPDRELQRQRIVRDLQAVFYGPQGDIAPDSPMKAGVKMLLDAYSRHEATQMSLVGTGSKDLRDQDNQMWNAYLDTVAQQQPMLGPVINHVFTYIKPDTVVDKPLLERLGLVTA